MNSLSKETSPYLLQHQHNPVEWFAWNDEAWKKARAENKLVLISIGYSSCHWCHVMEREVFEDFECAEFMNAHFVCIKVDREERPDVDGIYMDAIHLMGGQGGWPLNAFALPDGRPVYGGTYFPKVQWLNILENLIDLFTKDRNKMLEYADRLSEGLSQMNLIEVNNDELPFDKEFLDGVVEHWSASWDMEKGGPKKAPKFPMPNNLEFLLQYSFLSNDGTAADFVHLTLKRMALGGIYDQAGGGFSRYSVDDSWKVPHFEKMLYDNAQLISVYAQAYRSSGNELYKEVIVRTIEWAEREMLSPSGLFYAALDADSEGVEGKFYTWTETELREVLGPDMAFAVKYFRVGEEGSWEHDQNILLRNETDEVFAEIERLEISAIKETAERIRKNLMARRTERVRPGLDDKCLLSWNALMISAYIDAYKALNAHGYLQAAIKTCSCIFDLMKKSDGTLFHTFAKGKPSIDAFLDDYALLAEALLDLYEITGDEKFLTGSKEFCDHALSLFFDEDSGLFYFTAKSSEKLIARKREIQDNVIPASNSVMCKVLFRLAHHYEHSTYDDISRRMLHNVLPMISHGAAFSNWLQVYAFNSSAFYEVAMTGPGALTALQDINRVYLPNALFAASTNESELPLLMSRHDDKTAIYVCTGKTCFAPVTTIPEALRLITSIHK